jgi:hypothetical protein
MWQAALTQQADIDEQMCNQVEWMFLITLRDAELFG